MDGDTRRGNFLLEVKNETCYNVTKDDQMGINSILIENTRARRPLPANLQIGGSGGVSRNEGRGGRGEKEVSCAPFTNDSVAISPAGRNGTEISQELVRFHVYFTGNRIEIQGKESETKNDAFSGVAACDAQGVFFTDSKAVQEERSIGPYSLHVNQSAMKRYEQARSYRNWSTTTFEMTV